MIFLISLLLQTTIGGFSSKKSETVSFVGSMVVAKFSSIKDLLLGVELAREMKETLLGCCLNAWAKRHRSTRKSMEQSICKAYMYNYTVAEYLGI